MIILKEKTTASTTSKTDLTHRYNMKFSLYLSLFLFVFLPTFAFADVVDRSVAVVNDDIITLSEVNELGKPIFQQVAEQAPPDQLAEALQQARQTVIDKLIDRKILVQQANKLQISVSDSEVENNLQRILEDNKTSMDQFRKELATIGMNEQQYREDLKDQILRSKLINYEVRSKVIIPEEHIIDYYDQHYTEQVGEGGYYILQIGCTWEGGTAKEEELAKKEALQKAERVRNLAHKEGDFKELARQHSDLPSAADGGDLGVFRAEEMAPYMRDIIVNLKPGQVSEVVETPSGYQFYKLLSSQEGQILTKVPYESVKEEIRELLYERKMQERYSKWIQEIRDQSYIKIL